MNIEIGIGIGEGSVFAPSPSDRLIAYAWASMLSPSVSTSSVIHTTVNAVIANSVESALAPNVSAAGNAVVLSVVTNANIDALIPSVAIAGAITVNAVVTSSNANSMIPTVSTIRNVSVNGVIADSIASADVPTVSMGVGTTYYLQMDNADDYFLVPSTFTFNKVEIDCVIDGTNPTGNNIWSADYNLNYALISGARGSDTTIVSGRVTDARTVVVLALTNPIMKKSYVFAKYNGTTPISGILFDIKFYNSATLVAHYDMSTGTVLDQSGNGNHATLTGGTWVVA